MKPKIESCPESQWEQLCTEDPNCTIFQTPHWHRLAAQHYQCETRAFHMSWDSGEAVLPLLHRKTFGISRYFSPFGAYTEWVSAARIPPNSVEVVKSFLSSLNLELVSSPFTLNAFPFGKKTENFTHVVPLEEMPADSVDKIWSKGHRDDLRMAQKAGVEVSFSDFPGSVEEYYPVYLSTVERRGNTNPYPEDLLKNILKILAPLGKAKLWQARHEGQLIAACLVLYHNCHAVAWNGGAHSESFKLYPNQALYYHAIRDAKERGFRWFDFNPSKGIRGVEKFKEGFSAKKIPFIGSSNTVGAYSLWCKTKLIFGMG